MTQERSQDSIADSKPEVKLSPKELNQILEAILLGQYSAACYLLLRAVGHDPMHYIPYRTYNRLQTKVLNVIKPTPTKPSNSNAEVDESAEAWRKRATKESKNQKPKSSESCSTPRSRFPVAM
ncbi:MAG: HetP family heterocyst commitment protein [Leptolyngbyaceae bacterium]|nr:HetP family heterocyst commitment protein [Leptolyngbyaceae bacterium]